MIRFALEVSLPLDRAVILARPFQPTGSATMRIIHLGASSQLYAYPAPRREGRVVAGPSHKADAGRDLYFGPYGRLGSGHIDMKGITRISTAILSNRDYCLKVGEETERG